MEKEAFYVPNSLYYSASYAKLIVFKGRNTLWQKEKFVILILKK